MACVLWPQNCLIEIWRASSACTGQQAVARRWSELRRCGGVFGWRWHPCRHILCARVSTGTHNSLLLLLSAYSLLNIFAPQMPSALNYCSPVNYSSCCTRAVVSALIECVQDPLTQDLLVADANKHNIRMYTRSSRMETANSRALLSGVIVQLLKRLIAVKHMLSRCVEHRGRQE
jgi:hypothetical protein